MSIKTCQEWLSVSILVLLSLTNYCLAINSTTSARDGKFVSMFQVVKFPNDPCIGSGSRNGTCYTSTECSSKKGVSAGSCASGFGVCCTFVLGCGQTSSQNCTYFESTGVSNGQCKATVCKATSNICQIRLDFTNFMISGPSTFSIGNVKTVTGGQVSGDGTGAIVSNTTQCLTDSFVVTGSSLSHVPVLCGKLTGEHIYLEANPSCNTLNFNLGSVGIGTFISARAWQIKVTQYNCDYPNRAPVGCLQYFYGQTSGVIKSFNFDGAPQYHLANQQQTICIRRERTYCRVCYATAALTDFQLSGNTPVGVNKASCCAYNNMAAFQDCVVIPGASNGNLPGVMLNPSFCGRSMGLFISAGGGGMAVQGATICSKRTPFIITFFSDNWENSGTASPLESSKTGGFKLSYFQQAC